MFLENQGACQACEDQGKAKTHGVALYLLLHAVSGIVHTSVSICSLHILSVIQCPYYTELLI